MSRAQFSSFFLVWNPTGPWPPKYRHPHRVSAEQEAERLARTHGGTFYVLEVVSRCKRADVSWENATYDEIPF